MIFGVEKPWRPQPWMGPEQLARGRWDTHEEVTATIAAADTVTILSPLEADAIYRRGRGFIVDDAPTMGSPI
jgi:hypothetical protein